MGVIFRAMYTASYKPSYSVSSQAASNQLNNIYHRSNLELDLSFSFLYCHFATESHSIGSECTVPSCWRRRLGL